MPQRIPSLMDLHSDAHRDTILSKFDKLRKRDLLCDITLIVENVNFKAHKALLAASSEYFSQMFTAEDQMSRCIYELDGMEARTFEAVLEFIYSARVSVEKSSTDQLLVLARLLEVGDLVQTLAELSPARPAAERAVEDADRGGGKGEAPVLPKRKRGRPRKTLSVPASVGVVLEEPGKETGGRVGDGPVPVEVQVEADASGGVGDAEERLAQLQSPDRDDADCNPGVSARSRQSKRKIKPPVKFKGFRVGEDSGERREPGRRGRRRKYPNTEPRCQDCGKVFKNHLFLKIHRRTHTGEKPYGCAVCGTGFTQKHSLLVHQRMHTGEKPYVCTVCSKALSTKHSLLEHMNLHTEQKSFNCDKCGKTFSQKRQLKSHYRVHTGKSLSECILCHHKFMDAAQLKKHLRTHTGEKPFTCEICGKCFTAKSTLQTHIRIHRGEKPYVCNVCNKSFSDPSARRRHVASHTGKKPFTCSSCNLTFARLDNLKTHTKTHNKERPPGEAEARAPGAEAAGGAEEEVHSILQLQQYQLSAHPGEQNIQLVVTADVEDMAFVPGQEQGLSIITTEALPEAAQPQAQPRLTLLGQPSGHMQALVTRAGGDHAPQIQTISVLEGQPEQMHVITLSKEAMDHIQAQHGPPQPLHIAPQRTTQQQQQLHGVHQPQMDPERPLLGHMGREQQGQAIHINHQGSQPIHISQPTEQIPGHHIQGQTFQIQAGSVSYIYTTGLAQNN